MVESERQVDATPGAFAEDAASDRELLERFAARRDEAAFRALVERHGALVLRVCRHVLRDLHAAEDAFQATFFILARKAAAIERPELLSNWLYGVAHRVAAKARRSDARRRAHERQAGRMSPNPPHPADAWQEVRQMLEEEVARLPEKLRLPLVICCLEGRTNAEAAEALGCPLGSVSGRLRLARDRLHRQLVRRGVAISTGILALLLFPIPGLSVTWSLAERTARTATLLMQGETLVVTPALTLAELALHEATRRRPARLWWLLLLFFAAAVTVAAAGGIAAASKTHPTHRSACEQFKELANFAPDAAPKP